MSHFIPYIYSIPDNVPVSQELEGLEALEYQMSRNLETLRERHKAEKFGKTFKGMVYNVFGRLFAVYCIIRIISVSALPRMVDVRELTAL